MDVFFDVVVDDVSLRCFHSWDCAYAFFMVATKLFGRDSLDCRAIVDLSGLRWQSSSLDDPACHTVELLIK